MAFIVQMIGCPAIDTLQSYINGALQNEYCGHTDAG